MNIENVSGNQKTPGYEISPYDDTHVVATAESGRKNIIRIGSLNLPSVDEETTPEIADNVKARLAKLVEEFGGYAVRSALDKIAPLQFHTPTTADGLEGWKDPFIGDYEIMPRDNSDFVDPREDYFSFGPRVETDRD